MSASSNRGTNRLPARALLGDEQKANDPETVWSQAPTGGSAVAFGLEAPKGAFRNAGATPRKAWLDLEALGQEPPGTVDGGVLTCDGIGGDDSVHVRITPDNRRHLFIDGPRTDGFVQTVVRCSGRPPPQQLRSVPGNPRCDDKAVRTAWACHDLDFSGSGDANGLWWYMRRMFAQLLPGCGRAPSGSASSKPARLLMLGLGGGVMQSYLASVCPATEVTTVENNPSVVSAAKDFFGFKGNVIVEDARDAMAELAARGEKFDAAVVDIADTPLSRRDFANLSRLLKDGGLFLQNHTDPVAYRRQLGSTQDFFQELRQEEKGKNILISGRKAAEATQTGLELS